LKSRSIKQLAALAGLALAALAGSSVHGGLASSVASVTEEPKVIPSQERQRPGSEEDLPTSQATSRPRTGAPTIKCWQEGRPILEEWQWLPVGQAGSAVTLVRPNGGPAKLQLMDFGETFCVFQHGTAESP
jgi:hypothetical protein